MIVVSDSSPLIALSRIGSFDLLSKLFSRIYIPTEVYKEVAIAGAGLPGSSEVARASWIQVRSVRDTKAVQVGIEETGLGAGEIAAIQLALELSAEFILIDEWKARRRAGRDNLICFGCIALLEKLHERELLPDLRGAYDQLLKNDFRINVGILQDSLRRYGLKPV